MKPLLVLAAILLAACSGSTGPRPHDPTALLVNRGPADARDSMIVEWVACPAIGTCNSPETATFIALPGDSICTHFVPVNNPPSQLQVVLKRYEPNTIDTTRSFSSGFGVNFNETFFKLAYSPTAGGGSSTTGSYEDDRLALAPC